MPNRRDVGKNPVAIAIVRAGGVLAVAQKMGVSRATVSAWWTRGAMVNRRELEQARRLADISGEPLFDLLVGEISAHSPGRL